MLLSLTAAHLRPAHGIAFSAGKGPASQELRETQKQKSGADWMVECNPSHLLQLLWVNDGLTNFLTSCFVSLVGTPTVSGCSHPPASILWCFLFSILPFMGFSPQQGPTLFQSHWACGWLFWHILCLSEWCVFPSLVFTVIRGKRSHILSFDEKKATHGVYTALFKSCRLSMRWAGFKPTEWSEDSNSSLSLAHLTQLCWEGTYISSVWKIMS